MNEVFVRAPPKNEDTVYNLHLILCIVYTNRLFSIVGILRLLKEEK